MSGHARSCNGGRSSRLFLTLVWQIVRTTADIRGYRGQGSILAIKGRTHARYRFTIASTVTGYDGVVQGRGRIKTITLDTTVHGRGTQQRTGRCTLTDPKFGEQGLRWTPAPADELAVHRPVAITQ